MYISRFQVGNYKSFHETASIELTPGFNIISGQNNAGKTALLEALALNYIGKPHRSMKTLPARDVVPDQFSWARFSFTLSTAEAKELMLASPQRFRIARPVLGCEFALRIGYRDHSSDSARILIGAIFAEPTLTFNLHQRATPNHPSIWTPPDIPSYGLYPPNRAAGGYEYVSLEISRDGGIDLVGSHFENSASDLGLELAPGMGRHVFRFEAERMNLGKGSHGAGTILNRNAGNLPEVLGQLQHNAARFRELNRQLTAILPQVRWVSVRGVDTNHVEIVVWTHDPETQREDLAVPLLESGTGIAQILAILYVVMTSERGQTIIIDEPQSFLHPGAARKLIDFLRGHPQHQFIIATHSATIIAATSPETITLARLEDGQTILTQLDTKAEKGIQATLSELGVRLADSFGADNILWVEGRTEEKCFPIIVEKMLKRRLMGTQILGIRQTGDLESRDAKKVFEIYNRLANGATLLPPAVAFVLDQECRDDRTKEDLRKLSGGLAQFLPRRMYENFLLNPDAITAIANTLEGFRPEAVTPDEVRAAIELELDDPANYCHRAKPDTAADRLAAVHGARVLEEIFVDLSVTRVKYEKITHGTLLTEWLIEHAPEDLRGVAALLTGILDPR
jgi:putative AbiEii toxin of type IV toxin-antitoxin system/AAA ATPase-like protein